MLADMERLNIRRMQFPVRSKTLAVGAMEMMYDQKSFYDYRAYHPDPS